MDIMLKRMLELIGDKLGARKEMCDALGVKSNMVTEWEKGRNKSYPKCTYKKAGGLFPRLYF